MNSTQGDGRRRSRRRWELQQPRSRPALLFAALIFAVAWLGVWPALLPAAQAQSWESEEGGGVRHIVVILNKSRTLRFDKPFASAVVGSPEIVDALPMSDRALYIQGKKIGTTNVSVFDQSMKLIGVLDVEVSIDSGNLQDKIRSSTGSGGIRVGSTNGQIVLSGVAGNAVAIRSGLAGSTAHISIILEIGSISQTCVETRLAASAVVSVERRAPRPSTRKRAPGTSQHPQLSQTQRPSTIVRSIGMLMML